MARCTWKCDSCVDSQTRPTSNTILPPSRSKRRLRQSLRLLQWNCCGARSKQAEIVDALRDNNIDVACIQETKLRGNDATPKFSGYTSIRQDRANRAVAGGGLLTLVKDNLPFQRQHAAAEGNLEMLKVRLMLGGGDSLNIINVYRPPIRSTVRETRTSESEWQSLPAGPEVVIMGDVNAHHHSWDADYADCDGEDLYAWCAANEMTVANTGDKTRFNVDSGNFSAPDVTIVHDSQEDRITWQTSDLLSSDHKAIICELSCENSPVPGEALNRTRWNWDKADWPGFAQQLDQLLSSRPRGANSSIDRLNSWFTKCVISAAKAKVGQRCNPKFRKPTISDDHLRLSLIHI